MLDQQSPLGQLPASPTYDQLVYERLRRAIVDGELAPGQDLKVAVVAQQLGVSRIPVMQACQRLVGEGFLQPNPRKRLVVTPVTEARAVEGLSVLTALECLIVEAVVERADEAALRTLERANRAVQEAGRLEGTAGATAAVTANRAFHELLWDTAALPYVRELIQRVWDHLEPARAIAVSLRNTPASVDEHQQIIGAIRRRDVAGAQAAVQAHRQQTVERVRLVVRTRHASLASAHKGSDKPQDL